RDGRRCGAAWAWRHGHDQQASPQRQERSGQQERREDAKGVRMIARLVLGAVWPLMFMALSWADERPRLTGHSDAVNAVAFSPDGKRLASGSDDDTIRFWDSVTGKEVARLKGHADSVLGLAFSPDGTLLASAGADAVAKIWTMPDGKDVATLKGHSDAI